MKKYIRAGLVGMAVALSLAACQRESRNELIEGSSGPGNNDGGVVAAADVEDSLVQVLIAPLSDPSAIQPAAGFAAPAAPTTTERTEIAFPSLRIIKELRTPRIQIANDSVATGYWVRETVSDVIWTTPPVSTTTVSIRREIRTEGTMTYRYVGASTRNVCQSKTTYRVASPTTLDMSYEQSCTIFTDNSPSTATWSTSGRVTRTVPSTADILQFYGVREPGVVLN